MNPLDELNRVDLFDWVNQIETKNGVETQTNDVHLHMWLVVYLF